MHTPWYYGFQRKIIVRRAFHLFPHASECFYDSVLSLTIYWKVFLLLRQDNGNVEFLEE